MRGTLARRGVWILAVATIMTALVVSGQAQTLVANVWETRFQIDLQVPDEVLKPYIPQGFTSNVAERGPAKDCNLRLIFVDELSVSGPDGKPLGKGTNQLAYFLAPVTDSKGEAAQLMIAGFSADPGDVPGAYGAFLSATTHKMRRTETTQNGSIINTEDWAFQAASGEHLEMHIQYERGVANRSKPPEFKVYSAKNPSFYRLQQQEQVLDILKNVTTNPPDRVKSFSLKISGPSFAKLVPGTPKVLSWDKILWMNHSVLTP